MEEPTVPATEVAKRELPRYQCYKRVWALKIKAIQPNGATVIITPEEPEYASFPVPSDWLNRLPETRPPEPGTGDLGYYVVYADGYESWSPTKAFEEGYVRLK